MASLRIDPLELGNPLQFQACVTLLVKAFARPERYSVQRLNEEMQASPTPFYRRFFIAVEEEEIVGVGGVKAADWASHTHVLYLSAVAPEHRGQGIGHALVKARVDWVRDNFKGGRILVSSTKGKRFRDLGFIDIRHSAIEGRHLMMRRF